MANETEQLMFQLELENIEGADFQSGYSLNGKPILPPMMTDWKRLEMMRLRLCALTKEVILKRNQLNSTEKQDASTNTKKLEVIQPLMVMGRFRQKLERSETMIYDYTANMVMQIETGLSLPILMTSQLVMENSEKPKPQRAVMKVNAVQMGASEIGWAVKWDPLKSQNNQPKEGEENLKRCKTSPDLLKLPNTLWRRAPIEVPIPQLPSAIKSDPQIAKSSIGKMQSRIPKLIPLPPTDSPQLVKIQTARITTKRGNQSRKSEVPSTKPTKPTTRTAHLSAPKSIITPVPLHKRPGYVGSELEIQQNLFKNLVLKQAEENQRLQAKMQQQHQGLITTMINELNHAIEISDPIYPVERIRELDHSPTSSDPSQN
ncbi:uncharacterized protein [Drosophila takahashii]|uniref:uncharacterized protein n=1 Tax=Drosophila takahashii TaxID=29030 RepID=UPI001CF8A599|nr:uncharacterized protein LOC108059643 [Drosophila takahashii]